MSESDGHGAHCSRGGEWARDASEKVTVVSDVSGYTAQTERLDPEEVRETMDKVFRRASDILEHFGGRIDKLLGDGVMAIFGDPVAPTKTIRSGRCVPSSTCTPSNVGWGGPVILHSGIASGVVTGDADAGLPSVGPVGDLVNEAARLLIAPRRTG